MKLFNEEKESKVFIGEDDFGENEYLIFNNVDYYRANLSDNTIGNVRLSNNIYLSHGIIVEEVDEYTDEIKFRVKESILIDIIEVSSYAVMSDFMIEMESLANGSMSFAQSVYFDKCIKAVDEYDRKSKTKETIINKYNQL